MMMAALAALSLAVASAGAWESSGCGPFRCPANAYCDRRRPLPVCVCLPSYIPKGRLCLPPASAARPWPLPKGIPGPPGPPGPPAACHGHAFKRYPGHQVDRGAFSYHPLSGIGEAGNFLPARANASEESLLCLKLCANDPWCEAAEYRPAGATTAPCAASAEPSSTGRCFIFGDLNSEPRPPLESSLRRGESGLVVWLRSPCHDRSCLRYGLRAKATWTAEPLAQVRRRVMSLKACATLCQLTPACANGLYSQAGRECSLYETVLDEAGAEASSSAGDSVVYTGAAATVEAEGFYGAVCRPPFAEQPNGHGDCTTPKTTTSQSTTTSPTTTTTTSATTTTTTPTSTTTTSSTSTTTPSTTTTSTSTTRTSTTTSPSSTTSSTTSTTSPTATTSADPTSTGNPSYCTPPPPERLVSPIGVRTELVVDHHAVAAYGESGARERVILAAAKANQLLALSEHVVYELLLFAPDPVFVIEEGNAAFPAANLPKGSIDVIDLAFNIIDAFGIDLRDNPSLNFLAYFTGLAPNDFIPGQRDIQSLSAPDLMCSEAALTLSSLPADLQDGVDPGLTLARNFANNVGLSADGDNGCPAEGPRQIMSPFTPIDQETWSNCSNQQFLKKVGCYDCLLGGNLRQLRRKSDAEDGPLRGVISKFGDKMSLRGSLDPAAREASSIPAEARSLIPVMENRSPSDYCNPAHSDCLARLLRRT